MLRFKILLFLCSMCKSSYCFLAFFFSQQPISFSLSNLYPTKYSLTTGKSIHLHPLYHGLLLVSLSISKPSFIILVFSRSSHKVISTQADSVSITTFISISSFSIFFSRSFPLKQNLPESHLQLLHYAICPLPLTYISFLIMLIFNNPQLLLFTR